MRLRALVLLLLLAGCATPAEEPAPRAWAADVPVLGAWFGPYGDDGRAEGLIVREDGSALRLHFTASPSASVETPPDAGDPAAIVPPLFFAEAQQRNISAGIRIDRLEVGSVPRATLDALRTARATADPARERAFRDAGAAFVAQRAYELPPAPSPPAPPCARVSIEPSVVVAHVGEAARFVVLVEGCGMGTTPDGCDPLRAAIALPEGQVAQLFPSAQPQPARGDGTPCPAPGGREYAWDGRIEPYCPHRVADMACVGAREPTTGAYALRVSFANEAAAEAAILLVDGTTPRLPLVRVTEFYNKTRESIELAAQGVGCPDFAFAPQRAAATTLTPAARNASAVVLREFPQGGYGTFGPDALALPRSGELALRSVFDAERAVATLAHTGSGFALDGRPLPAEANASYDVLGAERYHIEEHLLAAEEEAIYVFVGANVVC